MESKINIIKVTADGEQISVDVTADAKMSAEDLNKYMQPYFDLCDARMHEMNKRIIASKWMSKRLTPKEQMHLHEVIEMLHGRKPQSLVDQAYQEAEENVNRAEKAKLRAAEATTKGGDKEGHA